MSATAQTPTPKGGRNKQRQTNSSDHQDQPEGRQLQPYFDDSIAGDAIQPASGGVPKSNVKPKAVRKKQSPGQTTPGKKTRQQGLKPPAKPAEQGYHSESGTAHYMNGSRSRSASAAAGLPYPTGGMQSASTSQPVLSPNGKHHANTLHGTPAKQVYAGPNFLASPAASSLPMPKAFTRNTNSNGSPPDTTSVPVHREGAQSTPLKNSQSNPSDFGREGSPLDFLFNADKAERLRHSSESASPLSSMRPQPTANGTDSLRPTPLRDVRSRSNGASPSRKDMLMQEMDGVDEQSESSDSEETPATTSYQQQMAALRSRSESIPDMSPPPAQQSQQQTQTDVLKQMLFASQQRPSPPPANNSEASPSRNRKAISVDLTSNHPYPQYGALSPLRSPTTFMSSHMPSQQPRPMPPRHVSEQKVASGQAAPTSEAKPDIKTMEDNLRKFLKIGS